MAVQRESLAERIEGLAKAVHKDEAHYRGLSTGEKLAVAFVLDRTDWLQQECGTILRAINRIEPEWLAACWNVVWERWEPEPRSLEH